jgi:hypothetical protein
MCTWDGLSSTAQCRSSNEPIILAGDELVFNPLGSLTRTEPLSWVPGVSSNRPMWHHRGNGTITLERFGDRTAQRLSSNGCGASVTAGDGLVFQVTVRSCGEDMTGLGVLLNDGHLRIGVGNPGELRIL